MRVLVEHYAEIGEGWGSGKTTPLHLAAQFGDEKIATKLIEAKVPVDACGTYMRLPRFLWLTYRQTTKVALRCITQPARIA
jgi:hypothetical protein